MTYVVLTIWPYLVAAAVVGLAAGAFCERLAHRAAERDRGRDW